ncbi:MAG: LamG domain-containing protein [Pirellulales bacterium]
MMKRFVLNSAKVGLGLVMMLGIAQSSFGVLLVNYQFESVSADAPPNTTTPDSSGTFTSASGTVNALLGTGTTPGTDYPYLLSGPVANSQYKSLNPNNAIGLNGGTASRVIISKTSANAGGLEGSFTNLTIAAWVNPTEGSVDRYIAGKIGGGTTSSNRGWQLYRQGGTDDLVIDFFQNQTTGTGNPNSSITVAGVLPQDVWTHVAFTFDNGTSLVYINGVSQTLSISPSDPAPVSINATNASAFMVGSRGGSNASNALTGWIGGIDDFRFYSNTLNFAGVNALLVAIPEPSSVAAMGVAGLVGLALSLAASRRTKVSE